MWCKFMEFSCDSVIESCSDGKEYITVGIDKNTGRVLIEVDPRYFRPAEVELLWGDSTKARTELGWKPSYSFMDLVKEMVQSDLEELSKGDGYKSKFEN